MKSDKLVLPDIRIKDIIFEYPWEYKRLIEQDILNIKPWNILVGEHLLSRFQGLKQRYPSRVLIPFAQRIDNDDIACWQIDGSKKRVVLLHDYASPGWEQRMEYSGFWEWFKEAIDDMIEYAFDDQ